LRITLYYAKLNNRSVAAEGENLMIEEKEREFGQLKEKINELRSFL